MRNKIKITSIENSSILRKFTILFFLVSIFPVGILYYIYTQIRDSGKIEFTESNFSITLLFVILGISIGYWLLRALIQQIILITEKNTKALAGILGEDKVKAISEDENEITVLAHSFNETIVRLEENIKNLEKAKKTLHSVMAKIGRGFTTMQNIDSFLELIVETVAESLSCRTGLLMLIDENTDELYVKTAYGIDPEKTKELRMDLNKSTLGDVARQKKPVIVLRSEYEMLDSKQGVDMLQPPLLHAPLALHDKVLGLLTLADRKTEEAFKEDELTLLLNVSLQTAVAIENSKLNKDIEKTYFETISALALAVEAKDHYSRGHLDRVADYATKIAKKLGLKEEDIETLRDAARLHDIGKIGVLDEVLNKPGPLTPEEWDIMHKHPDIGASIIMPITSLKNLCEIIRQHHEFIDGTGYPAGMKGDEVNLLARILTVADIFDALTSNRPYRKAYTKEKAIEILKGMNNQLDNKIVDALISIA